MDRTLFTNARLINPETGVDSSGSILVEDGVIGKIFGGQNPPGLNGEKIKIQDCGGFCLAPGIIDIGVKVCEPGERHKESFRTAGAAAAAGGVTTIVTRPDTLPPIDNPESLEFVLRRAKEVCPVHVKPMAALTRERKGRNMSEIGFLLDAGAVAFTDGDSVAQDNRILSRCFNYARSLDALVLLHIQDPSLSDGAAVTSGKFAALRGLPAVQPIAERIGLERHLALAEMTGVKCHADQISTKAALEPLKRAKAEGLDVTAGVSIHHLTLNELDIGDYRTFFKIKPPLRSEEDRQAVVRAVAEGLIDIISSMHTPQDEESKRLPFEEAASGAVGLETLLPAALRLYHDGTMSLPELFRPLSLNPARRFGLQGGILKEGAPADLMVFDPDRPFILDRYKLRSKSRNTPFDCQRMQGFALLTLVNGKEVYRHDTFDPAAHN